MKREYEEVKSELIYFETSDVILTSGEGAGAGSGYGDEGDLDG